MGDNLLSGQLSVDGATGKAGRIEMTGDRVGFFDAKVTADGATGGGEVLVGGDYQGLNPLVQNASRTFVSKDSEISADATIAGDGGKVIIWSDNGTKFYGDISVQGGPVSGDGGFVEVSGRDYLAFQGGVQALAPHGKVGSVLLDPGNMTINDAAADANIDAGSTGAVATPWEPDNDNSILTWSSIFALGANTFITTDNAAGSQAGDITITEAPDAQSNSGPYNYNFDVTITAANNANIVLQNGVNLSNAGTGGVVFVTSGTGEIQLGGDITMSGGDITFSGNTVLTANLLLATSGGDISFEGVGAGTISGAGFNLGMATGAGNISVTGAVGSDSDVLGDLTITSAGDVTFNGTLDVAGFIQSAGSGTTTFNANLETGAGFSLIF